MAVLLTGASRVVAVGAAGAYGSAQVAFMRQCGTRIVAHVSPGRGGETADGLPVFDTVADAVAQTGADAGIVYTPALGVVDSIVECAEAGLRLLVAAAEFVPLHDAMEALRRARECGTWVVGPNTTGISTPGAAVLGAIPPGFTLPGRIGVVGRSGTLTMTISRLLSVAGIGQSTVVHVGGDSLCGRNPHEWLERFIEDPDTDAVVYAGEIGGSKEYRMLDTVRGAPKAVVALVVGRHAPAGKRMGHAGALVGGQRETAQAKIDALRDAGALIAATPLELPALLSDRIR